MTDACKAEGLEGFEAADPEIEEQVFDSEDGAVQYLLGLGYHKTAPYARFRYSASDYTRDLDDGNRYQAWLRERAGKYIIESEGPEPSPEITFSGVVKGMWPFKVWKWHRKC